jgi:DNA repair protein RadC
VVITAGLPLVYIRVLDHFVIGEPFSERGFL